MKMLIISRKDVPLKYFLYQPSVYIFKYIKHCLSIQYWCVSRYGYVCASKTMALRRLLEAANSDTGFTNQEKGVCVCVALCGRMNSVCDQTEECCHAAVVLPIRS